MARIRFIMVGGFLGAGKTTALARIARTFIDRGLRVGLVTNDQAFDLVDTQSLRSQGFDVGEVTGACFCCKFNDLVATVEQLAADRQPDVILAEPVGSCTDLAATVLEPLARLYGDQFDVAPLAVLLKPEHGRKILSGETGSGFSPQAGYIFLKQIEEADVVAINKIDKLSADQRQELLGLVRERFPDKEVLAVSARTGAGFDPLISVLERGTPRRERLPEVDYDVYAAGEAELGWLNCTLVTEGNEFDLDDFLREYVSRLAGACRRASAEPAHLKVLATADGIVAVANLVASSEQAELSRAAGIRTSYAEVIVNARVAVDPEILTALVKQAAFELTQERGMSLGVSVVQSFRPGRPVPTHRMAIP